MRLTSYIGLRFLRSPRQTRSISVITWISGLGVMLGVTALIIAISVMNGFRANMVQAVTGTVPHARVLPTQGEFSAAEATALTARLKALPGVREVAPYFSRQAFLRVDGDFRAIVLRGIDPMRELNATELGLFLRDRVAPRTEYTEREFAPPGDILNALVPTADHGAGIVMGYPLARGLGLSVGDEVEVVSPVQRMTPIGPVPLIKRFTIVGVVETGIGGTDEVTAYISHDLAARLFRLGDSVAGLAVRLASEDADVHGLDAALGAGQRAIGWAEDNRNLFQVMRLEKVGVFLILTLIIVVSFFNIISSLVMLVLEKRRAIAVLMSMGGTQGLIRGIFFMQGVWIGIVGTLAGLTLGLAGCWALATFDLIPLPPGVFPLSTRLPVRVEWADLALITGASFTICLLVTLYPANRAARTDPIVNLRNE